MSHKMFSNIIAECIRSVESQCCTFDSCPLFKECFPDSYESWRKKVEENADIRNITKERLLNKT